MLSTPLVAALALSKAVDAEIYNCLNLRSLCDSFIIT